MHDFDTATCAQLASYYGLAGSDRFQAYLGTLGLRATTGTPKLAWKAFTDGAATTGLP